MGILSLDNLPLIPGLPDDIFLHELIRHCPMQQLAIMLSVCHQWCKAISRETNGDTADYLGFDAGLSYYPNLTCLSLKNNYKVTDKGVSGFLRLTRLKIGPELTDGVLLSLRALTSLDLRSNYTITDEGLSSLTNLTSLDPGGSEITDNGLSVLTNLTDLQLCRGDMDHDDITNRGISGLTNLKTLTLMKNWNITDDALISLTNLTSLNLCMDEQITDRGFYPFLSLLILI